MSGHSYFSLYILYFKYLPLNQSDVKRSDIQSHVPLVNSIALTQRNMKPFYIGLFFLY